MIISFILVAALLSVAYIFTRKPKKSPKPTPAPSKEIPKPAPLFIRDWPLLDFALEFGPKMEIGSFTNKDGRPFHVCRFTQEDDTETVVYFFSQLGELTPAEIKERKHELYVGQMKSGKYYLHDENVIAWETVNLGI